MPERSGPAVDPILLWDMHHGPAPTPSTPLPLLLGLRPGWREPGSLLDRITPPVYGAQERFATARASSPQELDELLTGTTSRWVESVTSGRTRSPPLPRPEPPACAPSSSARRLGGTVVAVIDDHCAFAHERFRRPGPQGDWLPRVAALWDQGGDADADDGGWWRGVGEFGYGRELDAPTLQRLFADPRCRSAGAIDEDRLYRLVQHREMERMRSHGTHVLDLAAGADPRADGAQLAPHIVFVQLPAAAVEDSSGHWLAASVIDALRYVHERVAIDAKLVVNLSFGALAGPHDGTQAIEQAIEHLHSLRPRDFALVLPAGNGCESGCHASASAASQAGVEFVVNVRPDDPTQTFVECWGAAPGPTSFWVLTPDGTRLDTDRPALRGDDGELLAEIFVEPGAGKSRARATLCMSPVLAADGRARRALAGRWRLHARNDSPARMSFDAWIERDEPIRGPSHPRAWQALFVDVKGDVAQVSDRTGTLNSIANGPSPIVVGACSDASDPVVCDYSGSGWAHGARQGPDVVALGDTAAWLRGVNAAGNRSAFRFRMRGTSVAAPQVSRWLARWLSRQSEPRSLDEIKAALRLQASLQPVRDPLNLGSRQGAGFIG